MNFLELLLGLLVGVGSGVAVALVLSKKTQTDPDRLSQEFFNKFNEKFPELLNQANSNLVSMASQKLGAQNDQIQTDLSNKKSAIEDLVKRVLDELNQQTQKLENAEKSRIGSFEALKESIEGHKQITQQLSVTAEGLKRVLSNNQMRGAFGEQIAEDLLKMSGFVAGVDYTKQETKDNGRPDYTILLPDGIKVNIDVKFPYTNLVKASEAEDTHQKDQYYKAFQTDIKTRIKEVCTRNYIDPENHTVDFVILFIPNEMIFSFIYEKYADLWNEAMAKKVILAGPFSFTAILRMVRQAYDNFRFQKDVMSIIASIKVFDKEFEKYNEEFLKIGQRIDSLSKQYNEVNTTRTNKLLRVVDRIKIEEPSTRVLIED